MAALPPEEAKVLQSLESDADAEMSSSSASEGDTLEYDMSEDLEDTPQNIKRDGKLIPTQHIILTFSTPELPKSIKAGYLSCPIKPYIPNPVRCFKCQKFGHSQQACRSNSEICAKCSVAGHDSSDCISDEIKCRNCEGDHPAFSKSCPRWILEKEIQATKIRKNISFVEARKLVTERTPKPGVVYSSAVKQNNKPINQPSVTECAHCGYRANTENLRKTSLQPVASMKPIFSAKSLQTPREPSTALQTAFIVSPLMHYNLLHKYGIGNRISGGVALLICNSFPSSPLTLNTSLQAIAVQIHTHSLITVCSLFLPPNTPVDQVCLNNLISQLPEPFIILGDMNGHSPLWGNPDANTRGLQIEKLLNDYNLRLLNNDKSTYFHEPTITFHSVDLAICTPSLLSSLSLQVDNHLHNSDHFPLIISDCRRQNSIIHSVLRYNFKTTNWCKFSYFAKRTKMVSNNSIDTAVKNVTAVLIAAADCSIPKSANTFKKQRKVWWNSDCREAKKKQRKAWTRFCRSPTTANLICYKQAKTISRRIQRQSKRESWGKYISNIKSTISSKKLWERVEKNLWHLQIVKYSNPLQ
ncbi:hypothetical protein AVEN_165130-1 [Araneus ventricosus]|uniref:CCHC-type domain-containing protein n=1 Tax=Araneus ventricosus TaxID=182803 RepID=A0A4Y2B7Z3_ARAVE|nr:hypothetical protein AVEN_165130-1 [Araneus ventricosus]